MSRQKFRFEPLLWLGVVFFVGAAVSGGPISCEFIGSGPVLGFLQGLEAKKAALLKEFNSSLRERGGVHLKGAPEGFAPSPHDIIPDALGAGAFGGGAE